MNLCVGDASAEQFVERYAESIYRLAWRITGVNEDAEEAVEDTLRAAVRAIHLFADDSAFGSWIYRAVGRAAHQRRKRRHVDTAGLYDVLPPFSADGHFEPVADWSNRIDEPSLQGELRSILAQAIDALPADYRTALILHDVEGVSKLDIAEILDVDVTAVSSSVHHARLWVRKRLADFFESGTQGLRDRVNRSAGAEHPFIWEPICEDDLTDR